MNPLPLYIAAGFCAFFCLFTFILAYLDGANRGHWSNEDPYAPSFWLGALTVLFLVCASYASHS